MLQFKVERIIPQRRGKEGRGGGVNNMMLLAVMISTLHHHLSSLSQQLSWQVLISRHRFFRQFEGCQLQLEALGSFIISVHRSSGRTGPFIFCSHSGMRVSWQEKVRREWLFIRRKIACQPGGRFSVAKPHTSVRVIKSDRSQLERVLARVWDWRYPLIPP